MKVSTILHLLFDFTTILHTTTLHLSLTGKLVQSAPDWVVQQTVGVQSYSGDGGICGYGETRVLETIRQLHGVFFPLKAESLDIRIQSVLEF